MSSSALTIEIFSLSFASSRETSLLAPTMEILLSSLDSSIEASLSSSAPTTEMFWTSLDSSTVTSWLSSIFIFDNRGLPESWDWSTANAWAAEKTKLLRLWLLLAWRLELDCVNSLDWASFKVRFIDVESKVIIELDWEVMTFGGI